MFVIKIIKNHYSTLKKCYFCKHIIKIWVSLTNPRVGLNAIFFLMNGLRVENLKPELELSKLKMCYNPPNSTALQPYFLKFKMSLVWSNNILKYEINA